jgi:hypothetical protein
MGLLRREKRVVHTVAGRALVVPLSTGNAGDGSAEGGSFNNWSNGARVKSLTVLRPLEAADGQPVDETQRRVQAQLPNWLRMIMYFAGSNDEDGEHFPAELTVPVTIDAEARTVVDVDAAMAELEPYRERAIKVSVEADKPVSPKEHEQHRRTARQMQLMYERDAKAFAAAREAAVTYGPQMARGVAAGSYPPHGFALWLELEEIKQTLTPDELAEIRALAGPLPAP